MVNRDIVRGSDTAYCPVFIVLLSVGLTQEEVNGSRRAEKNTLHFWYVNQE